MKKLYFTSKVCLLAGIFLLSQLLGLQAQTLNFQTWNKANNGVFTVDAFRSVTVDKKGIVWTGSDLGGLYSYNGTSWVKAATYTDVTFKDLFPSVIAGDTTVWAASIGKTGVQAITGGAYRITKDGTVTQYGSGIAGGLSSRYANSIVMNNSGTVYVALAQSLTGSTTLEGGVFQTDGNNPPAPSATAFTKALPDAGTEILYQSAGRRGDELWFARSSSCKSGTCAAPYIVRMSSAGVVTDSVKGSNSPLPFTGTSSSPFARAIFTDTITGNTYVGLSGATGTMGVMKSDGTWVLLNNANSGFPTGASTNYNAIAEVYGQIWVGTTAGIFVYNTSKPLTDASAFKLLTTADGLPSNSITDIVVDTARSEVWITSSAGISRSPYVRDGIKGIVYSVYCNKPDSTFYSSIQQKPIKSNVTVKLLLDGVEMESVTPDENGSFELKEGEEGKMYTVQVIYPTSLGEFKYFYKDVAYNTQIGAVLIPDSLMKEIKGFKAQLANRCFDVDLLSGLYKHKICRDGFEVSHVEDMFGHFFKPDGVSKDHKKAVNNLATYYTTLSAVYQIGGTSTALMGEVVTNAMDAVESLSAFASVGPAAKLNSASLEEAVGEAVNEALTETAKGLIGAVKVVKEGTVALFNKLISNMTDPVNKKFAEKASGIVSDAADLVLEFLDKNVEAPGSGGKAAFLKYLLDNLKKELAAQVAATYYVYYTQDKHEDFIINAVSEARDLTKGKPYSTAYETLIGPSVSLVKYANDTLANRTGVIENLKLVAKVADVTATAADAAIVLALVPGGQAVAGIAKGVALIAKGVKTASLAAASGVAIYGTSEITAFSDEILPKAGLQPLIMQNGMEQQGSIPAQQSIASLVESKNTYKQKLTDMLTVYNAPMNGNNYVTKLKALNLADSLYTVEMTKTLNEIWAAAGNANTQIAGFKNSLDITLDSFVSQQYTLRNALMYQNMAFAFYPTEPGVVTELNSLAGQIAVLNDSAVNRITSLSSSISSSNISIPGFLAQEEYTLTHTHLPNSNGRFSYKFKNYGTQPINNVSFAISEPTAGYAITSAKTIQFASIAAGETKLVSFNFTSPATEDIGRYIITTTATNGSFKDVSGSLYVQDPATIYSVKDGNWSNPATWSNNAVPASTSNVVVNHVVVVDVDASCKTLRAAIAGNLKIATGKKLDIKQ